MDCRGGIVSAMAIATDARVSQLPWWTLSHLAFALSVSAAYFAVLVSMAAFNYVERHLPTVDSQLIFLLRCGLV